MDLNREACTFLNKVLHSQFILIYESGAIVLHTHTHTHTHKRNDSIALSRKPKHNFQFGVQLPSHSEPQAEKQKRGSNEEVIIQLRGHLVCYMWGCPSACNELNLGKKSSSSLSWLGSWQFKQAQMPMDKKHWKLNKIGRKSKTWKFEKPLGTSWKIT